MRANRTTRIGIALLLVGLLLWGLYAFFRSLSSGSDTRNAGVNTTANNMVTPVTLSTSGRYAVLAVNIPERTIITPAMFRMEDRPSSLPAGNFITDPDIQAVGYVTNRPLRARQPLRKTDLAGHISEVGIAGALQRPDLRAMVVPITGKPALHPLVRVGDHVDVIAAFEGQESVTIVEDVRVLAVDVLASDYPPYSVAMRGSYKAPPKGDPRPVAPVVNPQGTPVPPGTPGAVPPGPTPTPAPASPPPAPTPALTLEVTPTQANAITLAQNAGAAVDFLIRPSTFTAPTVGTGGGPGTPVISVTGDPVEVRKVSVTRAQLSPYSTRMRNAGGAGRTGGGTGGGTRVASTSSSDDRRPPRSSGTDFSGLRGRDNIIPPPVIQTDGTEPRTPPMPLPPRPNTYEIPIYADGKLLRRDTVRDPNVPEPSY